MIQGVKHLIQCHCVLPQYRHRKDPVFHKFLVFSEIENDKVSEKLSQCPNCGAVHRVIDICKSEIYTGKEELPSAVSIEDIKICLPQKLVEILDAYSLELCDWEFANFILQNEKWGEKIKITSDETEEETIAKFLVIKSEDRFGIKIEKSQKYIG